jgi:hypothetical protein
MLTESLLSHLSEAVFQVMKDQERALGREDRERGDDLDFLLVRASLVRSYVTLARSYPGWASVIFEERFFVEGVAPLARRAAEMTLGK